MRFALVKKKHWLLRRAAPLLLAASSPLLLLHAAGEPRRSHSAWRTSESSARCVSARERPTCVEARRARTDCVVQ